MDFFRLYYSSNKDEIGIYPQVYEATVDYRIHEPNSSYHLHFEKSNKNTLWPVCKLSKKAKLTDLVSVSFMGLSSQLLISDKLRLCISKYSHDTLQFVRTKLFTSNGVEHDYWIVHPVENCLMNLDPALSNFSYLQSIGSNLKVAETNFKNHVALTQAFEQAKVRTESNLETHTPLVIDKIVLRDELTTDFFAISPLSYGGIGFFISGRLKSVIEENRCTGIAFTEINARYP